MGKKKTIYNGFHYFCVHFELEEKSRGIEYKSKSHLIRKCGAIWSKLPKNEKEPYETEAKRNKKNVEKNESSRHTQNKIEMDREKKIKEDYFINCYIGAKMANNEFAKLHFFIGHINVYCLSVGQNKYYPAEICVIKFSLTDGIDFDNRFNIIIDVSTIPLGYNYSARAISDKTHKLPLPSPQQFDGGIDEKTGFQKMIAYIRKFVGDDQPLPPIYFDDDNKAIAENIFANQGHDHDKLPVYSVSKLFFALTNAAHKSATNDCIWLSISDPLVEIQKDVFEYVRGISCNFHAKTDAFQHCSLSVATRRVYLICSFCCEKLNIQSVASRHLPPPRNLDAHVKLGNKLQDSQSEESEPDSSNDLTSTNTKTTETVDDRDAQRAEAESSEIGEASSSATEYPESENSFPPRDGQAAAHAASMTCAVLNGTAYYNTNSNSFHYIGRDYYSYQNTDYRGLYYPNYSCQNGYGACSSAQNGYNLNADYFPNARYTDTQPINWQDAIRQLENLHFGTLFPNLGTERRERMSSRYPSNYFPGGNENSINQPSTSATMPAAEIRNRWNPCAVGRGTLDATFHSVPLTPLDLRNYISGRPRDDGPSNAGSVLSNLFDKHSNCYGRGRGRK